MPGQRPRAVSRKLARNKVMEESLIGELSHRKEQNRYTVRQALHTLQEKVVIQGLESAEESRENDASV